MPHPSSQTFLRELDEKLRTSADKLRSNLDAAVYKHAVLGLIFLSREERVRVPDRRARRVRAGARIKYVSDSFAQRQAEIVVGVPPSGSASQTGLAGRQIEAMLKDPENNFLVDPDGYGKPAADDRAIHRELEERDYYIEKNVFWVTALARWKTLQVSAKLPAGKEILRERGFSTRSYKITSTGKLIDHALEAVEKENVNGAERHRLPARGARGGRAEARIKIKNVLNKNYTQLQIDPANLAGLIDLIATIPFQHADLHAKDILGHVYEYILGQFALAEGKKGGQFFTPKSIVSLIVEMIEPYQDRVYDPAMGSGGFFVGNTRPSGVRFAKRCRASARGVVQSERFIEEHGGTIGDTMFFGQDQWAWGAHLRRAPRAHRVRLRQKQPNQRKPTTWRLAAMNMAIRGIDFGKEPVGTEITMNNGKTTTDKVTSPCKITSTCKLFDDALEENPNGAERHRLPAILI